MICPRCRHDNAAGSRFCTACQSFLAWDGESEGAAAEEASAPRSPAQQERSAAEVAGRAPAQGLVGTATPEGDADSAAATADPGSPTAVPQAAAARRPDERPDVLQDVTGTGGPEPVPPRAGESPAPDRPCPRCRTANAPDRRLCASCGTLLDPAQPATAQRSAAAVAGPPWWRRMLYHRRDRAAAGFRPRPHAGRRPQLTWPVVVLALAVAGWFARAELAGLVTFVHDRSAKPAPLHPDTWGASSAQPGHPAKTAFDGYSNRYWAPASPGSGAGQYLEAGFRHAVHVTTVLITPGCSVDEGTFLTQARPSRITLTFFAADGHATRRAIALEDQAGAQTFTVHAPDATRVRLAVDSGYGAGQGRRLAVAEVEFFGRR